MKCSFCVSSYSVQNVKYKKTCYIKFVLNTRLLHHIDLTSWCLCDMDSQGPISLEIWGPFSDMGP